MKSPHPKVRKLCLNVINIASALEEKTVDLKQGIKSKQYVEGCDRGTDRENMQPSSLFICVFILKCLLLALLVSWMCQKSSID